MLNLIESDLELCRFIETQKISRVQIIDFPKCHLSVNTATEECLFERQSVKKESLYV